MLIRSLLILCVTAASATAQSHALSFKSDKPGEYTFNTGKFSGKLLASADKGEGIVSLVDNSSGTELSKGNQKFGIFSLYRLLGSGKQLGMVIWQWPKEAELLPDGAVRIRWAATEEHPAEIGATFRWTAANVLDLEVALKPAHDNFAAEVFVESHFNANTTNSVYLARGRHTAAGPPQMLAVDASALTEGTYPVFPRDFKAAQMIYDGRWENNPRPGHWSMSRYLAGPLIVSQDAKNSASMAIMSPPSDCFGIVCSYNTNLSADYVSNHHATYLSLFGRDIKAGQTATARARLVILKDLAPAAAIGAYNEYVRDKR